MPDAGSSPRSVPQPEPSGSCGLARVRPAVRKVLGATPAPRTPFSHRCLGCAPSTMASVSLWPHHLLNVGACLSFLNYEKRNHTDHPPGLMREPWTLMRVNKGVNNEMHLESSLQFPRVGATLIGTVPIHIRCLGAPALTAPQMRPDQPASVPLHSPHALHICQPHSLAPLGLHSVRTSLDRSLELPTPL